MEEANSWLRLRHQMCSWRRSSRYKSQNINYENSSNDDGHSLHCCTDDTLATNTDGRLTLQLESCVAGEQVRWSNEVNMEQRENLAKICHNPKLNQDQNVNNLRKSHDTNCHSTCERPKNESTYRSKSPLSLSYIHQSAQEQQIYCCNHQSSDVDENVSRVTNLMQAFDISCRQLKTTHRCTENEIQQQKQILWPKKKAQKILPKSMVILLTLTASYLVLAVFMSGVAHVASAYQLTNNLIANNLPPKFVTATQGQASNSEIVVRVKEGPASIGKLIYTLRGEDPDDDPLTFGVLGSMASDLLKIENVPGNQANVYLRKELDRETTESYQVVITLSDGKLGRGNWITKSMLIIVEDVNDNYPVFGPHRTAISIREDSKAPIVIETIEATDQDEGRFGQVIYKLDEIGDESMGKGSGGLSSTSVSSMFAIETIDGKGVISLIGQLDYEQRSLYQLRILAVDRAIEHERLSASTSIMISVEDCEDQPPMFTFVPSITRIPESLPVESPVVRVSAIDGDRGINNPIQHKLISVNGQETGPERQLFSMDAETGLISVASELDRESSGSNPRSPSSQVVHSSQQPGSYVLQVRASEISASGSINQDNSVTTELTILLTDVNDETPTFNQQIYHGEILENSAADNLVTFVNQQSANDQLSTSGQPPIAKVVDRDQGNNGTFSLHLEGEHAHLFDIWPHEATNEANFMIKVGSFDSMKFQLATGALDYEKKKVFQFSIVAREKYPSSGQARASSSAQMSVYLKDANDNYPQFESELYRVEIPENAIRGMHICAVKATDADSGLYGTLGIRYTEIRGEKANKFKLDPVTGVITLKTNEHGFDRETIAQHHLIVEARDNNGTGNRNTTQLLIILTDVNDQRPKFLLDQYEAFIYENELDFQSPLQVQALDNDAPGTSNSHITYSIVSGDPQQNFTIDPQSGRIRVRNSLVLAPVTKPSNSSPGSGESDIVISDSNIGGGLDFERIAQKRDDTRQFNLTIRATDAGSPEQLSGETQVLVLVYDRNDHAPMFTRSIYSKSIREDIKEGSQVLQVLAQDGDHSPSNSKITYRISSGASDKFVIDSDSGLISVANGANLDIDRATGGGQKRTNYLLSVLAFDGSFGLNQKSASSLVNISITDVNNKPPEFVSFGASSRPQPTALGAAVTAPTQPTASNQQQQVVYVNEDAPYGLIVTRVTAIDLDSSAELRYSINYAQSEARNEDMVVMEPALIKDLFVIDRVEGTIKVAKQLDRELFDQVKLRLQVEDVAAQTSDQVAYANLLVKITDVNDNRPAFKRPVYKAVVNENSIGGTTVITLTADDKDLNKTLKYSLDGSPEMMRLIRINPRTGEVTVNDKIDRELYPMINVTVRAEDSGYPHPLTGSAQLIVTVRDENDNNPMFVNSSQLSINNNNNHVDLLDQSQSIGRSLLTTIGNQQARNYAINNDYRPRSLQSHEPPLIAASPAFSNLPLLGPGQTASVREDAPIGQQVAYVQAEDADVGNNGRVTYLLDAASSGGKFRVDRDLGIISVAAVLDRETVRHYSLIIEACDNYDLGYSTGESRRAFTQVNIQITDINDNAPVITTNLQPTSGANAALAGTVGFQTPAAEIKPAASMHLSSLGGGPSYEEIMNSPGPYESPMTECLFINEFQPLNEPILTIIATDADDPSLGNGQIDLTILNGEGSSFALRAPVAATGAVGLTTNGNTMPPQPVDLTAFGDLALGESATLDLAVSESQSKLKRNQRPQRAAPNEADFMDQVVSGSSDAVYSRASLSGQTAGIRSGRQPVAPSFVAPTLVATTTTVASINTEASSMIPIVSSASSIPAAADFTVGEQQVHMVVSQSLREKVGNYTIVLRASDRGQPSLSTIKMINLCVLDVNNHSPIFIRPPLNHTIRVMENATIGTYVTQVEASDSDHGLNGQLQYSLKATNIQNNNNDWQAFKIDRLSGVISTAKQFNRQVKKYYALRVQAQDFGRPTALSSDIDINIMIVNSGQYQPEFDNQLQSVQFTENLAPDVESVILLPTANQDDDPALINSHESAPHGTSTWLATPCYFIIDSDDREQIFHLDRYSHKLTNKQPIDRERKANYTLLVQATNNCNRPPPMPTYASTNIADLTTLPTNSAVQSVKTRANDSSFSNANKQSIKGAAASAISMNLAAMDALMAVDKSLLKVSIKIRDVNDNAPRFTQRVYTGGITTEADFGTVFMIVQANDADADANSQIVYSLVKPIKRNLATGQISLVPQFQMHDQIPVAQKQVRQRRSAQLANSNYQLQAQVAPTTTKSPSQFSTSAAEDMNVNVINDIPMNEGDDLFMINANTGEISLNFDPQKHMKGYFEFDVMANDTDGLYDSAKVYIYLLRQDQRVKFVLRLTPQELRQKLNKFRSVLGNITDAIVNIDSYKYYENHDGTVDKKKTSLYLHFVNSNDNTIIDVDKVLTTIDNNIEYLDELYKEFHVLSSEAAHLPLSSSALIDPIDQIRTGLLGISSFLALILILVVALCLNQRSRYERQLKAATVSAFGSSPLHLDPDYQSQTNLPNTNLHSQDPNPIWINGYNDQDWLGGVGVGAKSLKAAPVSANNNNNNTRNNNLRTHQALDEQHHHQDGTLASEDADYLSSGNSSDLNSLSGVNSVSQLHYNATTTATPRDSLNSSQGRVSGSGSGSTSTTNERQALCRGGGNGGHQTPQQVAISTVSAATQAQRSSATNQARSEGALKSSGKGTSDRKSGQATSGAKRRSQLSTTDIGNNSVTHSTFGAFKEVTIYTDHHQKQYAHHQRNQQQEDAAGHATSQVNKIASQLNAKHQAAATRSWTTANSANNNNSSNQVYISQQQQPLAHQQRIQVHANGADLNHGIIKATQSGVAGKQSGCKSFGPTAGAGAGSTSAEQRQQQPTSGPHHNHQSAPPFATTTHDHHQVIAADGYENLNKLSILNLETTEL